MKKILVIDDESDFSFFIKANLELAGAYRVVTAPNGREGLKLAISESPDLILLDIIMPEINGLEVRKKLREDPRTQKIPVIMLTAIGKGVSKLKAEEPLSEEDYLVKPFSVEDLIAKMKTLSLK